MSALPSPALPTAAQGSGPEPVLTPFERDLARYRVSGVVAGTGPVDPACLAAWREWADAAGIGHPRRTLAPAHLAPTNS